MSTVDIANMLRSQSRTRLDAFLRPSVDWGLTDPPYISLRHDVQDWNDTVEFCDPYTQLRYRITGEFATIGIETFCEILIPICHSVRRLRQDEATQILERAMNGAARAAQERMAYTRMQQRSIRDHNEDLSRYTVGIDLARGPDRTASGMRVLHENMRNISIDSRWYAPQRPETEEARNKALVTLKSALSLKQLDEFNQSQSFKVIIPNGERKGTYEIHNIRNYSVTHLETGDKYCVVTPEAPVYDQMLAIKLLLENEPETYFAKANKSSANRGAATMGIATTNIREGAMITLRRDYPRIFNDIGC